MKPNWNTITVRFGKRAGKMLRDFANAGENEDAFLEFKQEWERYGLKWPGDAGHFRAVRALIRAIWEGKKKGVEAVDIALNLGIEPLAAEEAEPPLRPPIQVDWKVGALVLVPSDLNQMVWLMLLQNSRRLAICANRGNPDEPCQTSYFLKYRPQAQFCSAKCAGPTQRESKREWWARNRDRYVKGKKKIKRSKTSTRGER